MDCIKAFIFFICIITQWSYTCQIHHGTFNSRIHNEISHKPKSKEDGYQGESKKGIITDKSGKEIQNNEPIADTNVGKHNQDYAFKKGSRKKSPKVAKGKMKKSSKKSSKKTGKRKKSSKKSSKKTGKSGKQRGTNGKQTATTTSTKQYRCYSYNDGKDWVHRYMWHHTFRIPLFSVANFKKERDKKLERENGFVSDDDKKRPSLPCGGPVSDDGSDIKVPNTNEYTNTGYDRGHLLSSQMFRTYFPGKAAAVTEASNFMSNIWAQQPKCNRKKSSPWRKLEGDIADASRQCIKGGGNFLVSHGLIPDKKKIEGKKDIQKVKLAFVNYCCKVDEAVDESSVRSFTVNNPPEGAKCIGSDSANYGVKAINKEYKDALKTITDLNLGETFPFEMVKECIIGFKSKYEFPSYT